jgi:hypothetical protein
MKPGALHRAMLAEPRAHALRADAELCSGFNGCHEQVSVSRSQRATEMPLLVASVVTRRSWIR